LVSRSGTGYSGSLEAVKVARAKMDRAGPPRENKLVLREIQEIREALEAFNAAVEAWEMTKFKDGGMRSHDD
jgi:hypothetical protein